MLFKEQFTDWRDLGDEKLLAPEVQKDISYREEESFDEEYSES